jgi:hypothetical protein
MKGLIAAVIIATISFVASAAHRPFLEARYSPGLSDRCGWTARIDSDGTVTRFVEPRLPNGKCDTFAFPRPNLRRQAKAPRLSLAQLDRLSGIVREVDLATASVHPTPGFDCNGNPKVVSDEETLEITLTDKAGTHQSGIYGWRHVLDAADPRCPNSIANDTRRFLSAWVVVLEVVGSPNPGDNREQFNALLEESP